MIDLVNLDALNKLIDSRILEKLTENIDKEEISTWWDIDDLKRECKKGRQWCIDMLNYPPFKEELKELNIVYYPIANREGYSMIADKMKEWLVKNHSRIRASARTFRAN